MKSFLPFKPHWAVVIFAVAYGGTASAETVGPGKNPPFPPKRPVELAALEADETAPEIQGAEQGSEAEALVFTETTAPVKHPPLPPLRPADPASLETAVFAAEAQPEDQPGFAPAENSAPIKHPPLPPSRPIGSAYLQMAALSPEPQADGDLAPADGFATLKHPPIPPMRPAEYCPPGEGEGMVDRPASARASYAEPKVNRAPVSPYDDMIADYAERHGVPESFIHRIIVRESRYNPKALHNHCFGLLQLKYATAKNMGYKGPPEGLLDPKVNLTYGTPYIANAYMLARGDERRAIALYSAGYYYTARSQNRLAELRTAMSKPVRPVVEVAPPPPPAPADPVTQLFQALAGNSSQPAVQQ